jgi:AcrR family transcriptional regulator
MLAAALRLMRRRGFHEVTVGEIAAEAGVPTRALYRDFVNKLDILVEARERAHSRIAAVCDLASTRSQTAGEVTACLAQGLTEAVMRDVDLAVVTFRERKALARAEDLGRRGALADLEHLWCAALADARPELDEREVVLLVEMTIALIHHAADAADDHPERVAEIGAVAVAHLQS